MRFEPKPKKVGTFKKVSRKTHNCFSNNKLLTVTGLVAAGIFTLGIVADATKPKTKNDTVCTCTQTMSCTRTVTEGNYLPNMWVGKSFKDMISPKVTKIDEKGVEVTWNVETMFEKGEIAHHMIIPYGKSLKLGEGALAWEIKAEKGKTAGEAVVTVNKVSSCE
jgi:hypothetical protein